MKKISFLIFAFLGFMINVDASTLKFECPKEEIKAGESLKCDVIVEVVDDSVESVQFNANTKTLNVSLDKVDLVDLSSCIKASSGSNQIQVSECKFENPITTTTKIAGVTLTAPKNSISVNDEIVFSDIKLMSLGVNKTTEASLSKNVKVLGSVTVDDTSSATVSINCPKDVILVNESLVCDVSLNFTNTIVDYVKFTLDGSAKSNVIYEIANVNLNNSVVDDDHVTRVSISNFDAFESGTKIGKITLKSGVATSKDILLKDIEIGYSKVADVIYKSDSVKKTITVKEEEIVVKSDVNTLNVINIDGVGLTDFSSNRLSYSQSVKASSINVSVEKTDSKSKVTGDIGVKELQYGINNLKIDVTSESGKTNTYFLEITREDDRSKTNTLKSLSIDKASFRFNSATTSYNVTVGSDIEEVEVSSELFDPKSKYIEGYGNRKVTLVDGDNVIKVGIVSESGDERYYTINVFKEVTEEKLKSNATIKQVIIEGKAIANIPADYELEVKKIEKLDIQVSLLNDKATYEIVGNENLQDGSVVVIKVVSEDGSETREYNINVKFIDETNKNNEDTKEDIAVEDDVNKESSEELDLTLISSIVIFIIGFVVFIIGLIKYNKNNK